LELAREQLPQFGGMCIGRVVSCLLARGEIDAAAELFADPLTSLEQQQIFQLFDVAVAGIELALAQGNVDLALERAQADIARFTEIGTRSILPPIYHLNSLALIAAGRPADAAGSLAAALDLARELEMRGTLWRYLAALAALEDERGHAEAAQSLGAEAAAEIDFLLANIYPDSLRAFFLNQPEVARLRV
jgi:hypothetical protein